MSDAVERYTSVDVTELCEEIGHNLVAEVVHSYQQWYNTGLEGQKEATHLKVGA